MFLDNLPHTYVSCFSSDYFIIEKFLRQFPTNDKNSTFICNNGYIIHSSNGDISYKKNPHAKWKTITSIRGFVDTFK